MPFDGEKDVRKKTTVICPIHGNFETIIKNHLNGSGCKMDSELKTTEEILNEKNANRKRNCFFENWKKS